MLCPGTRHRSRTRRHRLSCDSRALGRTSVTQPRFALVLGGGAALGYAHLGVLDVFEQEGLMPDLICGTSMGALAGASVLAWSGAGEAIRRFRVALDDPWVMNLDFSYLRKQAGESFWDLFFGRVRKGLLVTQSMIRDSIVGPDSYDRILRNLIPDEAIEELRRPFACISTNLMSPQPRTLWRSGSLMQAVAASCAIPGIFPAQTIDGEVHVDGGSIENIPVPAARELGATFVVAVSVDQEEPVGPKGVAAEYFIAASHLARRRLTELQIADADAVLYPNLRQFHWADFQALGDIVEAGRRIARASVADIRRAWGEHQKQYRKGWRRWRHQ
ncbi:MAG: patatin-like phospholipase family protein [Candidatus Dadabacteria bacterium]|nr:MAG: patatin-like phospholipase family protein [Candidatus Dadabacteria bacterium]